ncbi:MAG: hypothetical protein HOV81_40780 [Kofleriaceae bacterium]|nr:hypothetical protein [Kofleriaceae bacterium]
MRRLALLVALAACKSAGPTGTGALDTTVHTTLAEDVEAPPPYGKAELQKALIAERGAEATAERQVTELEAAGDYDQVRTANEDLAVRRRFIASLEVCEAMGKYCPPRLDDPAWTLAVDSDADPKLDVPLRFDVDSWQKVAAEMHGRACACRTLACVDSIGATIDRLETRPMRDVQGDEKASEAITKARDCLFRLRGKRGLPRLEAAAAD